MGDLIIIIIIIMAQILQHNFLHKPNSLHAVTPDHSERHMSGYQTCSLGVKWPSSSPPTGAVLRWSRMDTPRLAASNKAQQKSPLIFLHAAKPTTRQAQRSGGGKTKPLKLVCVEAGRGDAQRWLISKIKPSVTGRRSWSGPTAKQKTPAHAEIMFLEKAR